LTAIICHNDNFEKNIGIFEWGNDRQPSEFGGSHSLFSDKAKFVSDMKHYETIEWRGLGGLSICLNFTWNCNKLFPSDLGRVLLPTLQL
jgi:hypothetical protein